ncbi:MAG: potassium channel protein [Actinobacteria bacterium]|nr:potassium channel protein [Actinomycetota bacterium]
MRRSPTRRLVFATGLVVALTVFGTIGYMVLGDASVLDALYMTIITIAAVGYSESIELVGAARLFTLLIIVLGVGSITFLVVSALDFVLEGHLQDLLGRRRMDRELARLDNHTVICGFGQVGRHVALHLADQHAPLVVVDLDRERVDAARAFDLLSIEGDASQEEAMVQANIASARAVVACAHDDADNVLISLTAKGLNPDAFVVARIKRDENEAKVRRAGADRVIAPAAIGGRRIAALVIRPGVVDFLDVLTHGTEEDLMLEELVVMPDGPLDGRSLRDLELRERHGVTVLAVQAQGKLTNTRPQPDTVLRAGDLLVVLAGRDALSALRP